MRLRLAPSVVAVVLALVALLGSAQARTAAQPKRWLKLSLDYRIPARSGIDKNRDRLVDYYTTRAELDPRGWTALITVRRPGGEPCDRRARYAWKVGGHPTRFEPLRGCVFASRHFPRLGAYNVTLTTKDGEEQGFGEIRVAIDDILVVGIGDSVGSGEGNPDIPAGGRPATWESARCDRSHFSFEAQAAVALEGVSDKTSVTLLHLACSGATIQSGLIGGYRGIRDPGGPPLGPQVTELARLNPKRKVDALLVSVGANDVGFGPIIQFCLVETSCPNRRFPYASSPNTLDEVVSDRIAGLPALFQALAARLREAGVAPPAVYITQYFDPTRNAKGEFCDPLIRAGSYVLTQPEASWAYERLVVGLNAAVAAAAAANGWHVVRGIQEAFRRHGYCSSSSWIVGLSESLQSQGDIAGTLHPNRQGQVIISRLVVSELKRQGITGRPG